MKHLSDDSSSFADSSDFVFATPPAQSASTVVGGTPAPGLGGPIDVPQEELQAEAAFAASGTGGTGSVVTVGGATSAGLTINLMFDAAAMAAPQSFRDGITQAMQLICGVVTDHITLNIQIDYSGTGQGAFGGPSGGNYVSYSTVHTDLVNNASPGDTTFNSLPTGSTIAGASQVAVWYSQEKLWGLLSPTGSEVDGSASFATDISPSLLVGVALHELTHAMGRVPYGSSGQPDIFDFYRFTSAGNILVNGSSTAPAAYFSLDGGAHKLADYGQTSDPSDFLNSGVQGSTDPFDEFYSNNTLQHLTAIDLQQLDALGFHLTTSTQTQTVIEAKGVTELVQVGNNYFLNPVAGGTGPELKYNGAAVVAGAAGTWSVIGAEATASGFDVAWHDSASNQFSIWTTDSNGNFTSYLTGAVSGTSLTLENLETTFQQDLNGDGTIGPPSVQTGTVIEAKGSTELVQVGSNYFMNPVAGGTGPELKYGGAPVVAGQAGTWSPIGAEVTSSGYDVAWHDSASNQYSIWTTDRNGNFTSFLTGAISGTSLTLEALEITFQQDLNGDHTIGSPLGTVIEASGSTGLVQTGNNYFFDPVAGGTGPELKYGNSPIVAGSVGTWSPVAVEQVGSGYDVAWHDSSSGQFSIWSTDSNGNFTSYLTGAVSGTSSTLESYETTFHQDLNGDGVIGVPAPTAPAPQVATAAPAAPASQGGGGDNFVFHPELGANAASSVAAPAVIQQIEKAVQSGFEHFNTELQHIVAGDLADFTNDGGTAHGPPFDLLHGFIIH
jgi:hypothetical protein